MFGTHKSDSVTARVTISARYALKFIGVITMGKTFIFASVLIAIVSTVPRFSFAQNIEVTKSESKLSNQLVFGATVIYLEEGIKETLDFYSKAFGFKLRYYDENLRFGELETGDTAIMIASYEAGELMAGRAFMEWLDGAPTRVEIAFLTEDVSAAYTKAIAAGAKPVQKPKKFSWGQTAAYVTSIEGTLIGILTPPPTIK